MNTKITIDPLTRISGFLEIQVEIDKNIIVNAKCGGMLFRGFEKMLRGRNPLDAVYFTERICGICSTAHAYASTTALEDAMDIKASKLEWIIRDIIHGTEFLQNHIRHFYLFTIPDYVKLQDISSIYDCENKDFRVPEKITKHIQKNYIESIKYSRMSHEALAVFGGKAPHNHGIFVGGVNSNVYSDINSSKIVKLKSLIYEIKKFVENEMLEDGYTICNYYKDYFYKGAASGNFMSYGLYSAESQLSYVNPMAFIEGKNYNLDAKYISENIYSSWYERKKESSITESVPSNTTINEDTSKETAYSFVKAPRYNGYVMEVGPLARMYISGRYTRGISAMDRMFARVLETKLIAEILEQKIKQLEEIIDSGKIEKSKEYEIKDKANGKGLIDTTRGSLGHWINVEDKKISNYDIVTPSGWNLSPMDSRGTHGAMEMALIGTSIEDVKHPVEIGRIVRTFDPCVSCATHVVSDIMQPIDLRIL